tara:strand:- start:224 stop:682 length:459 start_codon:yes stop_codon:yes gene_type:complete
MNALEKIAAKKKLTKKVLEALLGKKPREIKNITTALGAAGGVYPGSQVGAVAGLLGGLKYQELLKPGATIKDDIKNSFQYGLGGAMTGYLGGAGAGAVGGGALGRLIGKKIDKARLAKYKAKRNKRLAIGGGSAAGLAALLGAKKKSSKKGK